MSRILSGDTMVPNTHMHQKELGTPVEYPFFTFLFGGPIKAEY